MRSDFRQRTPFNHLFVKSSRLDLPRHINTNNLDTRTLFTDRAESGGIHSRGPRINTRSSLNRLTNSGIAVNRLVERRLIKIPFTMHLNMPGAISCEHLNNTAIRPIGQTDGYRQERKTDNHCESGQDCPPLLAEGVTKRNLKYHSSRHIVVGTLRVP